MLRFWRMIAVLCAAATGGAAAASAQTLPARKAGVPFACTGQSARMRWKLESDKAEGAGD
ncbi:MAG: hypothetical protein ACK5SX_00205 [Sandaracinobacter sp.]